MVDIEPHGVAVSQDARNRSFWRFAPPHFPIIGRLVTAEARAYKLAGLGRTTQATTPEVTLDVPITFARCRKSDYIGHM